MEQTSLRRIAKKAASEKMHRFRNLFGMLTVEYLLWCWRFINKRAAVGIDRQNAYEYGRNLMGNIRELVEQVKQKRYRAKLVLRRYIPKLNGKLRPLGLPVIADKVLQMAVAKILGAIYEQDFLGCSYGYRPKVGALNAVRDLTRALESKQYHFIVEADIKGFFDNIDHDMLMVMLEERIDDRPFLNLIRKWLKAGILNTDGQVIHPATGTPQGGIVSPILANIYLHYVLDKWFEEVVKAHCQGKVYFCRYADDFVCAFQYESDAQRVYNVLGKRLAKYGLEVAEDKTNLLRFSIEDMGNGTNFEFLGFKFYWELGWWCKPIIKRRTSRKKYWAALANFKDWCRRHCQLPKKEFFAKINAKLRGYYNYYGIRGNYESISDFFYQAVRILFKTLNRRSQRKSYNWKGFTELLKYFHIQRPRICHNF